MAGQYYGPYSPAVYQKSGGAPIYSAPQSRPGQYNVMGGFSNAPLPQVLGAGTSVRSSTPTQAPVNFSVPSDNGINNAGDEARRREEEARNAINSGYGEYESRLGGLQSTFQAGQQDELTSASKTYDQIFGGLTDEKANTLSKIDSNRQAVNTRQAQSIKDLQQNLSNTMRGASMAFGAMGAGDTSATRTMLPYAYTKLAGAQEGSTRNQSNDQLFQIDQDAKDTELEFSKMWRQTEVDKETSIADVKRYYGEKIANIQTAMAQAPLDKARDLAGLSQSLLQEAQANLRQLEAEDRQRKESARTWATQRMADLNNYKMQISGSANFNPQDIVWNELSMQGITPQTQGQESFYNPMLAQKRRQDYLGA